MRYKCDACLKEVGCVRFDLDVKERRQLCNKCYFAKDNKYEIIVTNGRHTRTVK
jgi:hypothetical protein